MLRFLHGADFHLDSAFGGLTARQAAARRRESRELPFLMADYINRRRISLVLLAGDLFDSAKSFRETGRQLAEALGQTRARVFISPGNHDWYGPGSPWVTVSWPANVTIFQRPELTAVDLPKWNLTVHGAAFTGPEQSRRLLEGFTAPQDGRLHIGLLHGEIDPSEDRYGPIRHEDIAASGLAYLALGHIHKPMAPRKWGSTLCAWPGCPEGRGFDETGERGFYEGTLDEQGQVTLTFLPFARRRYEILEVDVTGRSPRAAIESALPEDTARDLYRIVLKGETGEDGVDLPALREALADRFYALDLRDRTRLAEDVWRREQEDSLRGLFLRRMRARWNEADTEEDRDLVTQAARFGLAALDHRDLG